MLIAVDLSREKELDADPKAIQQIVKNIDGINADETQFMFILTILEKKNEIKIFSRKRNSIINNGKLARSES